MIKVLIVDDEFRVCQLICNLIDWGSLDMQIIGVAHNGIEARELARETVPDLVITDIRMPGCTGLELVEQLREIYRSVSFIIISGYTNFEYGGTEMKKVLAILLAIAMIAAMAACAQKAAPADETKTSGETTSTAGETVDNTADDTADTASSESYKIFLITMDQMDQYWTNIDAGCKKAAEELGNVEYQWTAPDVKDDAKQIEMINNAVANGANAILLAANGPEAVNDALKEASAAGVQIVYVDSPANFTPSVATFSTDNTAAGKTAGQTMIDQLAAKGITEGKIGIVSVNAATASTVARDDGFRSAFEGTKFELQESQYCDGDAARSKDAASAFIADGCVGVFGCNEGSTVGVGNAIKESGADVVGVGFDSSDNVLELINEGCLYATMVQNPDVMGYEGVKAAVAALQGGTADGAVTDTGVTVVTK